MISLKSCLFAANRHNQQPVAPQPAFDGGRGIDMIVKVICIVIGMCIWEAIKHAAIWLYRRVRNDR